MPNFLRIPIQECGFYHSKTSVPTKILIQCRSKSKHSSFLETKGITHVYGNKNVSSFHVSYRSRFSMFGAKLNSVRLSSSSALKDLENSDGGLKQTFCRAQGAVFLKDMTYAELEKYVVHCLDDESKRARDLWAWLYRHKLWASHPSAMEGRSKKFRQLLAEQTEFDSILLDGVRTGKDGTRKLTFQLKEDGAGGGVVETVLIPHPNQTRNTVCISSQLGCAMGCEFCFTAKMGLQQNLSVGQIVDQVVQTRRLFTEEVGRITNVVFMGMGEPLHNIDNVLQAAKILSDQQGLQIAAHRITVSTSGLVPEIRRFCQESGASLAVSINATTDEIRSHIMPINRRYNITTLFATLKEFFPSSQKKKVFLEYIMLQGVNDSFEDARRLIGLTEGLSCTINLIVFNPHEGTLFFPSDEGHIRKFQDILVESGRMAFVRNSRGDDEMAACGQLGQVGNRPVRELLK